mmetsp:Transcript_12331/g.21373  ORF Transcript_12331/g.21373 Transcript_12331/m.21373 type:complete len:87 (-) Transcript_12331:608-868(-)
MRGNQRPGHGPEGKESPRKTLAMFIWPVLMQSKGAWQVLAAIRGEKNTYVFLGQYNNSGNRKRKAIYSAAAVTGNKKVTSFPVSLL